MNVIKKNEKEQTDKQIKRCAKALREKFDKESPSFYIHSYGCSGSVADGQRIQGIFELMGCTKTQDVKKSDIFVLNGCAIREKAQNRVIGNLGALVHLKQIDKNKIIILCGCMFQQEELSKKTMNIFKSVDLVFGTHVIDMFPQLLLKVLADKKPLFYAPETNSLPDEDISVARDDKIRALVPISYGCDNFCSYCIVPYVKGRQRSRKSDDIIRETRNLVKSGYKEITLLGQNVNSYGGDLKGSINFSELLKRLGDIDGDFRIRFMTSHPKDATKELIETIKSEDKVCKHIHLPVQSGSDRMLKAMNRKYTVDDYLNIVNLAKGAIPDLTLTSDIIVGFPGESEADFEKTLKLVREVEFLSLFTFIYSKRPYTKACNIEDQTKDSLKKRRLNELIKTQSEISENLHKDYLGSIKRVLIEGVSRASEGRLTGRTDNHVVVDVKANKSLLGEFVDVKIDKAYRLALRGQII